MQEISVNTAQGHCLLREFRSPAYFSAKNGKVNPRAKRFVYLGVKGNNYRLWDPEGKKIVMSRNVTFGETAVLKSTVSQQVERTETKERSQRVEVDATPSSPVGSTLEEISLDVTPGGYHDTKGDAEQVDDIVEDVELFAAIGTKVKPRLWACGERSMNLKLVIVTS